MSSQQQKSSNSTSLTWHIMLVIACALSISCQKTVEQTADSTSTPSYLYVSSGLCFAASGVTTFSATTSSNLVYRVNTSTGVRDSIIADYNSSPASAGDTPTGIVDWDTNNLLVLVGNGASGRIEYLPKTGGTRSNFGLTPGPATIFSAIPRFFNKTNDGGFFTARSGAIDKMSSSGVRQSGPSASANYVMNNLGATCGTVNTTYTFAVNTGTTQNRIIAGHAFAGTNRLISLPSTGGNTSCTAAQAAPSAGTSWPLAAVFDKTNSKLIVAWGNSATTGPGTTNLIIAYDYNDSTGAFGTANIIYDIGAATPYPYTLYNISAMALDSTNNYLYVATAISTATTVVNYAIEKFSYDATKLGTANSTVLGRVGSAPFYNYGVDTKCISSMVIGN